MKIKKIEIHFNDDMKYSEIVDNIMQHINKYFEPRFYNTYIKGNPYEFFKRFDFVYHSEDGEVIYLKDYEYKDIFKAEIERRLKQKEELI